MFKSMDSAMASRTSVKFIYYQLLPVALWSKWRCSVLIHFLTVPNGTVCSLASPHNQSPTCHHTAHMNHLTWNTISSWLAIKAASTGYTWFAPNQIHDERVTWLTCQQQIVHLRDLTICVTRTGSVQLHSFPLSAPLFLSLINS